MSGLADLQQRFQQCVLDPPTDLHQPWVRAGGRAPPARQLSVYTHAYPARLAEALAGDYPALRAALDNAHFARLAQAYIAAHPSHSFTLRTLGAQLPAFAAADSSCVGRPWLAELAAFEWTLGLAFDAADTPATGVEAIAALAADAWPTLRFAFHPSLQRLDFAWNTPAIRAALSGDPPEPPDVVRQPMPWLIWREALTVRFRSLAADESAALDCLLSGGDFTDACAALTAFLDERAVPLRAAALLKGWASQGLITRLRTGADAHAGA